MIKIKEQMHDSSFLFAEKSKKTICRLPRICMSHYYDEILINPCYLPTTL